MADADRHRIYKATYSIPAENGSEICVMEGDELIIRPLPSGEWPNLNFELTGVNVRTGLVVRDVPGCCVEFLSEHSFGASVSVSKPAGC